jgi:hypothetical protein
MPGEEILRAGIAQADDELKSGSRHIFMSYSGGSGASKLEKMRSPSTAPTGGSHPVKSFPKLTNYNYHAAREISVKLCQKQAWVTVFRQSTIGLTDPPPWRSFNSALHQEDCSYRVHCGNQSGGRFS